MSGTSAQLVQRPADRPDAAAGRRRPHRPRSAPTSTQAISDLDQVKGSTPFVGGTVDRAPRTTALGYLHPLQDTYQTNAPLLQSLPALRRGRRTAHLPARDAQPGRAALLRRRRAVVHHDALRPRPGRRSARASTSTTSSPSGDTQRWRPVHGQPLPPQAAAARHHVDLLPLVVGLGRGAPARLREGVPRHALRRRDRHRPAGPGAASSAITGPVDLPRSGSITADNLVQHPGRQLRQLRLDRRSATSSTPSWSRRSGRSSSRAARCRTR